MVSKVYNPVRHKYAIVFGVLILVLVEDGLEDAKNNVSLSYNMWES